MAAIRFRSRHLHATFFDKTTLALDALGWLHAPVNFGTSVVTVIDFQPEERSAPISNNTVAVSLGDFGSDDDEEMGASVGGLRSALYSVYVDVFMAEQPLSMAICDDIRDIFVDQTFPLVDQITQTPVFGSLIQVEDILGPAKPPANLGAEQFKRNWRIMRIDARLFYQT